MLGMTGKLFTRTRKPAPHYTRCHKLMAAGSVAVVTGCVTGFASGCVAGAGCMACRRRVDDYFCEWQSDYVAIPL
jgi:hypothetical protein